MQKPKKSDQTASLSLVTDGSRTRTIRDILNPQKNEKLIHQFFVRSMSGDKEDFVQVSNGSIKVFDENGEISFVFEGLKIRSVVDVDH